MFSSTLRSLVFVSFVWWDNLCRRTFGEPCLYAFFNIGADLERAADPQGLQNEAVRPSSPQPYSDGLGHGWSSGQIGSLPEGQAREGGENTSGVPIVCDRRTTAEHAGPLILLERSQQQEVLVGRWEVSSDPAGHAVFKSLKPPVFLSYSVPFVHVHFVSSVCDILPWYIHILVQGATCDNKGGAQEFKARIDFT